MQLMLGNKSEFWIKLLSIKVVKLGFNIITLY